MADAMQLAPVDGKLTKQQVQTQQIIGSLKFIEKVNPRLSLPLPPTVLCVMSAPPPDANVVAKCCIKMAFDDRDMGITFGGLADEDDAGDLTSTFQATIPGLDEGAPQRLKAAADASWGDSAVYGA